MAKFKYIATTLINRNCITLKTISSIPNNNNNNNNNNNSFVFASRNIFHQSRPHCVRMCAVPNAPYIIIIIIIIIFIIIIIIICIIVSCHRPFLPGTSREPAVIPTVQASSFTLQYFPYYA